MQTNRQAIAALFSVVQEVARELEAAGGPDAKQLHAALDVVQAWLDKEKVTARALNQAAKATFKLSQKHNLNSTLSKSAYWLGDAVAKLCWMAATGTDNTEKILEHTGYAVQSDDYFERVERIRKLHAAASVAAKSRYSADVIEKPARRVDRKKEALAREAFARSQAKLGERVGALLSIVRAERDPGQMTAREELTALLKRKGYRPHESVLEFEEELGGLLIPDDAEAKEWRDQGTYTLVGAYACLRSNAHEAPRGGDAQRDLELVPVAYTQDDGICFMDKAGKIYFQDTIADMEAEPFLRTGGMLVSRLVLAAAVSGSQELEGKRGARLARRLGLSSVDASAGKDERWWASRDAVVWERRGATVAAALGEAARDELRSLLEHG